MSNEIINSEPVLVIMAAGMGSRYGGLKQIDPLNNDGDLIIDFSIYDAIRAGFKKVIFIIQKSTEADFRERIGDKVSSFIDVEYVFQDMNDIPDGFSIPEGRVKPWGTGHAIYACREKINGPFLVINSDDYYGRHAFEMAYEFLSENKDPKSHMMVAYRIENTLTDNGYVSRGECKADENNCLADIKERLHIERLGDGQSYLDEEGNWIKIPMGTLVSMNMWGLKPGFIDKIAAGFPQFLEKVTETNPLKGEYLLPEIVGDMIEKGEGVVHIKESDDKWYGVTYKEDKEKVTKMVQYMKGQGMYPTHLWMH